MIYLDNAATTKPKTEVVKSFLEATEIFGNPNSPHLEGIKAYNLIEEARIEVAKLINAEPEQIIFTSGGAEANNLAIRGILAKKQNAKILCNSSEHTSMIRSCYLSHLFKTITPDLEITERCIKNADVVSVMHTNNETGKRYDVNMIGNLCNKHNTIFVTDAVQALGHCDIDVKEIGCDMMSMSSHKLHGIKGTGALFIKNKALIRPLIYGGENQEYGLRGGTQNVPGIVAFGKACSLCNPEENYNYIRKLNNIFWENFTAPDVKVITGNDDPRIIPLTIKGVDSETLVFNLAVKEVCVSSGAACKNLSSNPNTALIAQGYTKEEARHTIRISFSEDNSEEEIKKAAKIISDTVVSLRYQMS